jgi:Fe-S-cluster containining protein
MSRLAVLFDKMDCGYAAVAGRYGFVCRGCKDNCCLTRFTHHTLIEYHYLLRGFASLDSDRRKNARRRADMVVDIMRMADASGLPIKEMCPLNAGNRCILYSHRPMICRLHGLPHELHPPGKDLRRHPGCDTFYDCCRPSDYIRFDRTPFYMELSKLERDLRAALGVSEGIRMTIAQMLANPAAEQDL